MERGGISPARRVADIRGIREWNRMSASLDVILEGTNDIDLT